MKTSEIETEEGTRGLTLAEKETEEGTRGLTLASDRKHTMVQPGVPDIDRVVATSRRRSRRKSQRFVQLRA